MAKEGPKEGLPTVSGMLRRISRDVDLDLAATISDYLNMYTNAMKRSGRSIYMPDDAVRILHGINAVHDACKMEPERPIEFEGLIRGTSRETTES